MAILLAQFFSMAAGAGADAPDGAFAMQPWAPHVVALFAFAAGIAMWLAGRSYLRLTFCLAGGAMGAMSGFELMAALAPSMNPFIGAGIGLALGALLGLVTFRFVVAVSLGMVGAIAATLIAMAALAVSGGAIEESLASAQNDFIAASPEAAHDDSSVRDGAREAWKSLAPLAFDEDSPANNDLMGPVIADAAGDLANDAAERAKAFFAELVNQAAPIWNDLPTQRRVALSGAAVAGLIIGLLGGFLLPSRAAAVTTAVIGPAIWMPTGVYLLGALGAPLESWIPSRPLAWIGLWLGAATIGLLVQWTRKKPNSDKA